MALAFGSVVSAQDDMMLDPCFGLSADDCAVINTATANGIGDAQSFTMEMTLDFVAENVPEDLAGMSALAFGLDGTFDFTPGGGMLLPVNVGGTLNIPMMGMALNFRVVDDFVYFQDPATEAWQGINLAAIAADESLNEQVTPLLEGAATGDTDALGDTLGVDVPDLSGLASAGEVLTLDGLFGYVREGDAFTFTVDLSALEALTAPENEELLESIVTALNEIDPTLGQSVTLLPLVLDEGLVDVIWTIDSGASIIQSLGFNAALVINGAVLTGDQEALPTTVTNNFLVSFTNLDSAPVAEAPAEFEDVTEEVIAQIGALAGSAGVLPPAGE